MRLGVDGRAGYAIWLGLLALAAGVRGVRVGARPRPGPAAGIAGAITFGGFLLNGYQGAIPSLAPLANLTWFGWTSDHLPLAGQFDWAPLILVAIVVIVLCTVGIEAFVRRDLGATSAIPSPGLPRALARHPRAGGTDGQGEPPDGAGVGHRARPVRPLDRGFRAVVRRAARVGAGLPELLGNDLSRASTSARSVASCSSSSSSSGWSWSGLPRQPSSGDGRPMSRPVGSNSCSQRRATVSAGSSPERSVSAAASSSSRSCARSGSGSARPAPAATSSRRSSAHWSLDCLPLALAGIGIAVGGLVGPRAAAPAVAILTIVTWLIDIISPALGLPDAIHGLALTSHFGLPMVGVWDGTGVAASLILAVVGVAVGAWGFARRDLDG